MKLSSWCSKHFLLVTAWELGEEWYLMHQSNGILHSMECGNWNGSCVRGPLQIFVCCIYGWAHLFNTSDLWNSDSSFGEFLTSLDMVQSPRIKGPQCVDCTMTCSFRLMMKTSHVETIHLTNTMTYLGVWMGQTVLETQLNWPEKYKSGSKFRPNETNMGLVLASSLVWG